MKNVFTEASLFRLNLSRTWIYRIVRNLLAIMRPIEMNMNKIESTEQNSDDNE